MSVSQSAPLACEVLVQPLEQLDPRGLEGRWALVAGSTTLPYTLEDLKPRGSVTVYLSNSTEISVYSYTQASRLDDRCYYLSHNFTSENNTFTSNLDNFIKLTWSILYTSCPDCLMVCRVLEKDKFQLRDFFLFSRRRQLKQREMEEFLTQVECLNMPPPDIMDPTRELCPEQTTSDPAAQNEEKPEGRKD